jgi:glyoxylase-like metal-dependent hydrolase (beta-lactamase superfamily II)
MQTAIPSVYPAEGTFESSSIHIDLACVTPGARIHYTVDGSQPTADSPVYRRELGLLLLKGRETQEITIAAFAEADGLDASPIVRFHYTFNCCPKGVFRHELLREPAAKHSGIIRIEDFDLDKMYLVIGQNRAVLVDAGWDETGDLPALCHALTGGLPIDLIIAHGHPDHIAQIMQFVHAGSRIYMPHADARTAAEFGIELPLDIIHDIPDGTLFDLGGTILRVYSFPGHTPGGIVLVDEATGDVFSSDELGSNRRYIPDTAWLQINDTTLESCLRTLERFMAQTDGKLKRIFTGHNDEILDAQSYLKVFHTALKKAVDGGEDMLVPSLRSAEESFGSGTAAIEGDYRCDPVWAGANLKFLYDLDTVQTPPHYVKGFFPNIKTQLG